jgi:Protein of unknown function (DUF2510)
MDVGWYPDPQGSFDKRFFDGRNWTDHVSVGGRMMRDPRPSELVEAAPVPAGERVAQPMPWLAVLGGLVMVAAVILTAAIVVNMDSSDTSGGPLYSTADKLQAVLLGLVAFGIGGVLAAVGRSRRH